MFDTVDWSMDDIDAHCEKHKPDIIVIDQLDKVNVQVHMQEQMKN